MSDDTMNGENHIVMRGLEIALIEGTPVKTFCGDSFVPTLRVGSGGQADEPTWPMCEICESVRDLVHAEMEAREESNRMLREVRAIQRQIKTLRGGKPIKVIMSPRKRVEVTA